MVYWAALIWSIGTFFGEGVLAVGVLMAAAARVRHRPVAVKWRGAVVVLALMAFAILSHHSGELPKNPGTPWNIGWLLAFPLAVWLARQLSTRALRMVAMTALALGTASAVLALVQHLVLFDASWLAGIRPVERVAQETSHGGYRGGGFYFHRLKFAHTTVLWAVALMPVVLGRSLRIPFAARLMAPPIWLLGLYGSDTRAPWLALGVGVLAFFWARTQAEDHAGTAGDRLRGWLVVAAVGSVCLSVGLAWWGELPADRAIAWRTALQLFADEPLVGVGYGRYRGAALAMLGGPMAEYPMLHFDAHSLLLQPLAEMGLAGVSLVILCVWRFFAWRGPLLPAEFAVWCAALTLGLVHNLAFHPEVVLTLALTSAMAGVRYSTAPDQPQ